MSSARSKISRKGLLNKHSPFSLLGVLTVALPLSSCANYADKMAPKSYNAPWAPGKGDLGQTLPVAPTIASALGASKTEGTALQGKDQKQGDEGYAHKPLKLPNGYVLPSVKAIKDQVTKARDPAEEIIPSKEYNLVELIDIAQSSNPQTRQAWNTARNEALEMGITRSSYLPQLTGTVLGGYAHETWHSKTSSKEGGAIEHDKMHLFGSGVEENVSMRWLLFDYGRRATMRAQQELSIASNVSFTGTHQKVIFDVAQAYYSYNAALKRLAFAQMSYKNTTKINQIVEARLKAGQATVVDTSQSRAAVANAEMEVVRSKNAVSNEYLSLLNAMGINPQAEVKIKPRNLGILSAQDVKISKDLVDEAVARRPDVIEAMSRYKASKHMIQASVGDFLPKIFVTGKAQHSTGSWNFRSQNILGTGLWEQRGGNNFAGGIAGGVTMPLFDGGMRLAELKKSRNKAENAAEKLRQVENEAVKQIVMAENGVQNGYTTWKAATRANDAAQTGFDAGITAYRSGEGNLNRLLDLQDQLFKAQVGKSDAYYGSLIAAASLAYSTGSLGSSDVLQAPDFEQSEDE